MRRLFAIVLVTLPACSLFTSLGDFSENENGGTDGSTDGTSTDPSKDGGGGGNDGSGPGEDGAPIGDSGDAGGFPNLHPNGEMEFSCQGWYPYNSTLTSDPIAHGGMASCRVCADKTTNSTATIDELGAVVNPTIPGTYYASAWLRATDDKPPPSSGIHFALGSRTTAGADVQLQYTAPMAIDKTWKKIEIQLKFDQPAGRLRIYAGGNAELGTCFLIDDVRVEHRQ